MNKKDLKKLSKSELINLLLKQEKKPKPVPTPRTYKSVKDMVQQYEDLNQSKTVQLNDFVVDLKNQLPPIPAPRTKKPVPEKRTIISQVEKALKGYT